MKKETLTAVFLGVGLGIVIAYGIHRANKAIKKTEIVPSPSPAGEQSSVLPKKENHFLSLKEPENNLVFKEKIATISGQTTENAVVAILAENQEEILMADKEGFFSTTINLIPGINELTVVSIDKNGDKKEEKLIIIQSSAKI